MDIVDEAEEANSGLSVINIEVAFAVDVAGEVGEQDVTIPIFEGDGVADVGSDCTAMVEDAGKGATGSDIVIAEKCWLVHP